MRKASSLNDSRINAVNVLVEMTVKEYMELITDVISNNDLQRKRVTSSKTVYALLRKDLLQQCVIPPIVLALTRSIDSSLDDSAFSEQINTNKHDLIILDGLQRTHTILELLSDLRAKNDEEGLRLFEDVKLRVEIYIGLNRLGILYRMLTLNTGQTPMSLRQQIEMLYLDYLRHPIDGIELIREADNAVASRPNQYNFKDVIEGFNAYLDRDELPIDKADILENINSLEKLAKENQSTELFEKYVVSFNKFVMKTNQQSNGCELNEAYLSQKPNPFGKNAIQIFKKPQAMSGFGAAIGKLIDFDAISNFDEIQSIIDEIEIEDPELFLEEVNNALYWLKVNSKKIGNAQRSFFTFMFRDLFNKESDGYKKLIVSSQMALRKYQAQNM